MPIQVWKEKKIDIDYYQQLKKTLAYWKIYPKNNLKFDNSNITLGMVSEEYEMMNNKFWEHQVLNYDGQTSFKINTKNLLLRNNIRSIRDIINTTEDNLRYCLFNRLGNKQFENSKVPIMYINQLPTMSKCENSLTKVLFINKERVPTNYDIPSYESNEYQKTPSEYFFTASHRTFFKSNDPYFIKVDVPYKISNKKRTLTRNESRICASDIVSWELSKSNYTEDMEIFEDVSFYRVDDKNLVLRRKDLTGVIAPLFAAFTTDFFDDESLFDYFYEIYSTGEGKAEYLYKYIISPIINHFSFFTKISMKYQKLIFPYDFHMQNINIKKNSTKKGFTFVYQDFDMSKEMTVQNIFEQIDFFLKQFVIENIVKSNGWLCNEEIDLIYVNAENQIRESILEPVSHFFFLTTERLNKRYFPEFMEQYKSKS